jgi:acylphosphatase
LGVFQNDSFGTEHLSFTHLRNDKQVAALLALSKLCCEFAVRNAFMLAIVYISSAVQLFSDADLAALLKQSRQKNAALEITGILLYKDGDVMQLLEGPDEAVEELAKTIYADKRHSGIIELIKRKISRREFPDWSMEFQNLGSANVRQLSKFMHKESSTLPFETAHPSPILRLLESFGMQ